MGNKKKKKHDTSWRTCSKDRKRLKLNYKKTLGYKIS